MSQTYRALLVGTGSVAESHVRAIEATSGRVQLVGAVEVDAARGSGPLANATKSPRSTPTTPPRCRSPPRSRPDRGAARAPRRYDIAALEAGAWVLCEKPYCASLAELDRIDDAERRTGRFAACVFQQRFASSTAHVRRLAAEGLLGRPLVAVCNTLWFRDATYYAVPWRGKWATDFGGPTMGLGIHAMDHLLHLLGDWAEVRASGRQRSTARSRSKTFPWR
jgi:predicted dehydrogenase